MNFKTDRKILLLLILSPIALFSQEDNIELSLKDAIDYLLQAKSI